MRTGVVVSLGLLPALHLLACGAGTIGVVEGDAAVPADGVPGTTADVRIADVDARPPRPDSAPVPANLIGGGYDDQGNVYLPDTAYEIPEGAIFVAVDGRANGAGSESDPVSTLARGIAMTAAGRTIVMREGTYREGGLMFFKPITIQPYPHEKVWLKGSVVVSGWVSDAGDWRRDGWMLDFPSDSDERAIDSKYPLAGEPDMVFIDGRPLKEVASRAAVAPGKFFVDGAGKRLFIGDDPTGKTVEAAAKRMAINIEGDALAGSIVRGIGFAHYATSYLSAQAAPLRINSNRCVVENNAFAWNATTGLAMYGDDGVARGNIMAYNGLGGGGGSGCNRLLFEKNQIAYNNQEHFRADWTAAGTKMTEMRDTIWRENIVENNIGHGMWCDIDCLNVSIVHNTVRGNRDSGIFYEISANGLIASNQLIGNGIGVKAGAGSNGVRIYNNTFVTNREQIIIVDDERTNNDPVFTWDTAATTIKNNIFARGAPDATHFIHARDYSLAGASRSADLFGTVCDFNAYHRTSATFPRTLVEWWRGSTPDLFADLAKFLAGTGNEAHGLVIDDTADPFFMDAAGGDYRLRPGSVAIGRGEPLPADIAEVVGVTAGIPVDLGALKL